MLPKWNPEDTAGIAAIEAHINRYIRARRDVKVNGGNNLAII